MPRLFDYWEKGEPLELWTRRLRLDALFALVFFPTFGKNHTFAA